MVVPVKTVVHALVVVGCGVSSGHSVTESQALPVCADTIGVHVGVDVCAACGVVSEQSVQEEDSNMQLCRRLRSVVA